MNSIDFDRIDTKKNIVVKGARVHNLKNIDVVIPRNQLTVITGLSGSGKSSLAFDTLYAEGQRRYIESLSSYARQFLGKIDKPEVDYIKGISPAIAIEQKVNTRNPRSTVGTSTEVFDYLKLLFARIGKTISPVSGNEVKRDTVSSIVQFISELNPTTKLTLLAPITPKYDRTLEKELGILFQQGFSRIKIGNEAIRLESKNKVDKTKTAFLVVDRFVANTEDEDNVNRISDSLQTGLYEGNGEIQLEIQGGKPENRTFSNRFELDGITFEEPSVHFFSFNNPIGACKKCEGFGSVIGIDQDLVIPNKTKSIFEEAILCWKGEKMSEWKNQLVNNSHLFDFPIHKPYFELSPKHKKLLWTGNEHFDGLNAFFRFIEEQSFKIQYRVMLSRYRGKTPCPDCKGSRLRKDANYVKVDGHSITDIVLLPLSESLPLFQSLNLSNHDQQIAKRLLIEITNRLQFLNDVGLGYLTLNRLSSTLSGGESQRINLATSLGSSLVGSMYILDEPSIGLHPKDTERLIKILIALRDVGNTVIVVEHDEDIMLAADQILDLGPEAGTLGGELVFQGNHEELLKAPVSLTTKYLTGIEKIEVPKNPRNWKYSIDLYGARENNLKNVTVKFPLNTITCVTGVSGSGKTTLVKRVFYPAIQKLLGEYGDQSGQYDKLDGDYSKITSVEFIDQNPIGRSSRSNPVTYVKAYDEIRSLFAKQQASKINGFKPAHFSFNVPGGRCEVCEGEGRITVEMQFMADIHLQCDSCKGHKFKDDVLEVRFKGKNIYDILSLTIDDAIAFFNDAKSEEKICERIVEKLLPLQHVGLGYVQMGQASSTLSGGEAQRIKLASFLGKGKTSPTLFIFDEPTTGLHFHDIKKLLKALNALVDKGHSLIVIEHNQDVIKCADWVIDLGPEGGDKGGTIVFEGTPKDLSKCKKSFTGGYLKGKI
ncbi:MAG: excinuclease ABC subunit UvrA [Flavobacteriales bacterium]|nr:excinuclease ABC subunit UvrA [Flavobacteriales bacterium]